MTAFQDLMHDNFCWGCGADNPDGLQIKTVWDGDTSLTRWTPQPQFAAGPRHILNGGIIATLLDCHGVCTAIADRFLKGRSDVAVVDFHTGLGPYGYGEPITHYDIDTPASRRVRAFWGESVTESKRGQTASQARDGLGHYGLLRVLKEPETRLTMCTLEYGTFDRESGQKAFRADHWLHKYGDPLGKEAGPVRAAMRRQFYPDTDDWKEAVLFRGHQVVRQAIDGVQRGAL